VTWLMHAVHGNEISSRMLRWPGIPLLAAQKDPTVDMILMETVVLIDPLQKPGRRARFLQQTLLGRAHRPIRPGSAEHDGALARRQVEPLLFDMNR